MSGRRFQVANFARLEQRNFWYSEDRPDDHDARFRNRVEFKLALNRDNFSEDGLWYAIADTEWFVPIGDEAAERYATKRRLRLGIGYRISYQHRLEVLLMRDKARDTREDDADVDANMLDIKYKWFF